VTCYDIHAGRRLAGGIFLLMVMVAAPSAVLARTIDYFGSVERRLVTDGFDPARIEALYDDSRVSFETRGVSMYFVHSEGKLDYDQFLAPPMIEKARNYMEAHADTLRRAEQAFGVDRQVITAILLVETKLGAYVGNRLVINTFSTMAALSDPSVREVLWYAVEEGTSLSRAKFEAKALQKSAWAYGELKSFLVYTRQHNIDPLTVKGSYAGALGYCQFLPSNILKLGRDGSGDGRLDLFDHADAIMSVAGYLDHHGWEPGISEQRAGKVIYRYNHSPYYVAAVMKIARELKR